MAIFSFGKKTTPLHLTLEKQAEDAETQKLQKEADVQATKESVARGIKKAQVKQKRKTFFRDFGRKSVEVSKKALVTTGRASGRAAVALGKGIYRAAEVGGKRTGREEKQFLQQRFGKRPSYRRTSRRRKSYSYARQTQPTFVQTTSGAFVQVAQPQQQRSRPRFRRQINRNVTPSTGMDFLLGSGKSSRNGGGYDDLIGGGNGDMLRTPRRKSSSRSDILSDPLGLNSSRRNKRRSSDDYSDLF